MPSLDDLKKRIKSVKSTQKITKAMKMVAAAKLRRAQESAEKGRPFSEKMNKEKDNTCYVGKSHHQVGLYMRVSPYRPPHIYKFLWCVC